ncbi:MAG: RNA polymerase factor sigma-32 [Polyangiales bacterium]
MKQRPRKPRETSPDPSDGGDEIEVLDQDSLDTDLMEGEVIDLASHEDVDLEPRHLPVKASSSALSARDPLSAYMRDVQRYPLLTPEKERELAIKYVEEGDVDAARSLVTANLRLVVKIAYDYRQAYKNLLDLVQEGNIGLMQAVRKYDPYKGVKLSSYAAWWIRAYMLRFILNNFRLVKVGTTQAQRKLFFNLKKEKARLAAMGIDATPELIAERLAVPASEVVSMDRRLSAGEASLDKPVGNEEGKSVARVELLDAGDAPIDDVLANAEINEHLREKIHEFGKTLTGKDRIIFEDRLLSEEPLTLQELGESFGVSRERVRQLEKRVLTKLKAFLDDELGDAVLDVYES